MYQYVNANIDSKNYKQEVHANIYSVDNIESVCIVIDKRHKPMCTVCPGLNPMAGRPCLPGIKCVHSSIQWAVDFGIQTYSTSKEFFKISNRQSKDVT